MSGTMRDVVFGQARGLANQWKAEATKRLAVTSYDVGAAQLRACAEELEATLGAVERDTKPLTVPEYAKMVGAYPGTVRKWIASGQLTAEKNASGDWMIPRAARRQVGHQLSRAV